jgi:hypothetical protein
MEKYNIEDNLDFFNELYKSFDDAESIQNEEICCLITHDKLTDHYVELNCGHKFNYLPLYKDILNHKKKFNMMEATSGTLKSNEIRCPYCRKKQSQILPYIEELNLEKVNGVNFIDPYYQEKHSCKPKITPKIHFTCEFLTPNINFDPESDVCIDISDNISNNCKFIKCKSHATSIQYKTENDEITNFNDEKKYCYNHKRKLISYYKKQIKNKEKEELNLLKLTKKLKIDNTDNENVVLGPSIINSEITSNVCICILKSGVNKGNQCGRNIYKENMCKRHYNFVDKNIL